MALERRQYPRIATAIPATLTLESGKHYSLVVRNISRAGVQLECDRDAIAGILPGSVLSTPVEPVLVRVEFALAIKGRAASTLRMSCKVLGATRLAANVYRISVQYQGIDAATFELVEQFIGAHLAS